MTDAAAHTQSAKTTQPTQSTRSTKPAPNKLLRYERTRRGWSQQELADRIGAPPLNISRWESGANKPSPYFRQKLCEVFEKQLHELGFVTEPIPVVPESTSTSEHVPNEAESYWNVPYRRNIFFTGREDILAHLHDAFLAEQQPTTPIALAQPHAISGLGGIGKTQTAIEYAHRYRDHYRAVFWARADSYDLLVTDFLSIAILLHLPERNDQEQSKVVAAVLRWFDMHDQWLLILDNADNLDVTGEFLPTSSKGHVLLTTRAQAVGTIAQRIELDTMPVDEATFFLLRRARLLKGATSLAGVPKATHEQARAIVEAVDGLPLALDQAGAYIEETKCGLNDYLKFYKTRSKRLLKTRGKDVTGHPEPVATTWSLSFEKVERANPAAAELLRLCAFLHPDAIPESLLLEGASELGPVLQPVAEDELDLNEAISELLKYSLIKRDAERNILNMHRLVQVVLKDDMHKDMQREWAERTVRMVSKAFPDPKNVETWPVCQHYLSHALVCTKICEQENFVSLEVARLLYVLGSYFYQHKGSYTQAERLLDTAIKMVKALQQDETPLLAEYMNKLGEVYHDEIRYEEAELFYTQAMEIWKRTLGPMHPTVAGSLNNLGLLAHDKGNDEQLAEKLHTQALAIRKQVYGEYHSEVAQSMDHLAVVYLWQDKHLAAEALYVQAVHIREHTLTPHDPSLAFSYANIGAFYHEIGKYGLAEHYKRKALAIREQILEAEHPDIISSLDILATTLIEQEKYIEAEQLCLRAIKIGESKLSSHELISCYNTLGKLYYKQGDYVKAEPACERALHMREELYGLEHSIVAQSLTNLAQVYRIRGKYTEAEALLERALHIRLKAFGSEHFHVAHTLFALARLYSDQDMYEKAEPLFLESLRIREHFWQPNHPDIALSLEQYAQLLRKTNRTSEAEALEARAQAIRAAQEGTQA